jgi:hypothetical protein
MIGKMEKSVFSKIFAERLRGFTPTRQDDLMKAVGRVLSDPTHNNYARPKLKPYKQEHPSDKTLTIFFAIPSKPTGRVFFVWVNDDRHPHSTHKNFGEDPCVKEFIRLRDGNLLEDYSLDYHEGKFTVTPRLTSPSFAKFEKYGASVYANISYDGNTYFAMSVTSMNAANQIFDHYQLFIDELKKHFVSQKQQFEFRVPPGDTAFQIMLQNSCNPAEWNQTNAGGMDIWSIK